MQGRFARYGEPLRPGRDLGNGRPEWADLGRLARRAVRGFVRAARVDEQVTFTMLLREHLGEDTADLGVVVETWPSYDHVNVQAGLDAWLADREHRLIGVAHGQMGFRLTDLLHGSFGIDDYAPIPGNVARTNLPSGPSGRFRPCVTRGLYLVAEGATRAALLLRRGRDDGEGAVNVEIVATADRRAAEIAGELRALSVVHNVFRRQVLSFSSDFFGGRETVLHFHERPKVAVHDLILPEATLRSVTRQVVGIAEHRAQLLAAGQHLKRGLLLHGPPGVGKTHTVRYLTSRLTDATILELSGRALGLISEACSIARTLQPSLIIVEDVDLIAEDRRAYDGHNPLLFQLLNEMDGLAEDADVVFLLTTNRADLLEPALAQRPGRIDQAVEIKLPDADARRRLIELYRGELEVDEGAVDDAIRRTEGVTASFLKELLRRAAVFAAESSTSETDRVVVTPEGLAEALDELLDTRNAMTRVLLGGQRDAD
jgi:ATPase family associated with various cellular activities (AAA)